MLTIEPTGQILGATVRGVDLARPLAEPDFAAILRALGDHGVLRFPDQRLDAAALRDFSRRFGSIQDMLTGLMWDHIGTLHNALADYGPDEPRLMKRCQVMADRIFDPAFRQAALQPTADR